MITVEAKKVGARMIATVKVGISTGRFTYTVQFADQGSEAANEAEAQRELRKTLKKFLKLLVHLEWHDATLRVVLDAWWSPAIAFDAVSGSARLNSSIALPTISARRSAVVFSHARCRPACETSGLAAPTTLGTTRNSAISSRRIGFTACSTSLRPARSRRR